MVGVTGERGDARVGRIAVCSTAARAAIARATVSARTSLIELLLKSSPVRVVSDVIYEMTF